MNTSKEFIKFALFDIVKQRPNKKLNLNNATCPFCKSKDYINLESITTLLGWSGKTNPNHQWHWRKCSDCNKIYVVEEKENNIWIVDIETKKVMDGMPSCFEDYLYTCSKCNGDVYRFYTSLKGDKKVKSLSESWDEKLKKYIKHYRIFFECKNCGVKVETEKCHWY